MTPEARERWIAGRTKHGGYSGGKERPEHYVWRSMHSRCANPNDASYPRYGGRGIRVCREWRDYATFIKDMGLRPGPKYSIERVDVNAGYCPSNCKWATPQEQQKNRTNTRRWVTGGSEPMVLTDVAAAVGISKTLALWRWKMWGTFVKGQQWQLQSTG